jgi:OmpA-OmpF porin, OOP family
MKKLILIIIVLSHTCSNIALAQMGTLGDRISDDLSRKAQEKIESEIDHAADKAYDKSKEKTKEAAKNNGKKTNTDQTASVKSTDKNKNTGEDNPPLSTSFKSYSKYDFIPGDKVIAIEDFMQDAIGDFPDKWNTNGSGEVVTINDKPGHWLQLTGPGISYPEFIKDLPENFTFEFDLVSNPDMSYYSTAFTFNFVALPNEKQYPLWGQFPGNWEVKINGVRVFLHPQNAGNTAGMTGYECWENGAVALKNESGDLKQFYGTEGRNFVHVAIWRQKQRLRVYVNEEKVWDIPKAFQQGVKYTNILFNNDGYNSETDRYSFSNLKLAVGAPDTRNKLITEGKFVTRGILFDVNSANIKSESYGVLKDIATVLTENPDVRVKIVGHTDSDGDETQNMDLSRKRAEAVKASLSKNFGINSSRMETEGKGESQPADVNTTAAGKANNRRVEFIKL